MGTDARGEATMKALIGVDGSPGGYNAVQFASRLLSDKDEILLYYSPPGRIADGGMLAPVQLYLSDIVFEQARRFLPQSLQARVQQVVCHREASQGIPLMAIDRRCDLIVLGARGTGPVRERALGAVSHHIVDHATTAVLLVRCVESRPEQLLRVLLASDGSTTSRHAGEILRRFTWPKEATGMAMTVVEAQDRPCLPDWLEERLDDEQLEQLGMGRFCCDAAHEARIRSEAAKWYGELPAIFAGREPLVAVGHAAEQVLAAIAAHRIDLVVVGARRIGPIQRLLLGSTSTQVVAHAPCSVLVVRNGGQPLRDN
jgi:nucleotide-binding universal stress UspA family protein